ncbi:Hsp20/alpha crystallin family protein [Blautia massiliensis (ex Durand et al. 2017)]|uniref:Hsp20/alpha crystallin family protein n=1 Tax=Blautia massiliensis (ex Durand et al. 2017) TaxID=1737424 RepID=UPI00242D6C0D|nr:Hsp20/alpha crystallin family protein [Blautia massiliensis (ex Durand et al. 2017)]MDD6549438.1 Hsp20/alpha crystallin family protein [Blautia massiliensis (ex Durand et al. 2017)]
MMYMPSIFRNDFVNDWTGDFFQAPFFEENGVMKTDIREDEKGYDFTVELPGFRKENISLSLNEGVLNIKAVKDSKEKDEKEKDGKIIRIERYSGNMERSFYVGDEVSENDIAAKFENGVLNIHIAKKEPQTPEPKKIAIG